ncbi:hypothetical protein [Nocardioides alcanivorans]|uniref:hypothetical protein n=1 Tax=Nocardioides alcanivorans TaxID=2897352 RepID=UPI001F188E18|nr:hypothetical protein [Nocardioides alcanivorans]
MRSYDEWEPQAGLFDQAPTVAPPRARSEARQPTRHLIRHRLANDDLVEHGWPAGTLLMIDPDRRAERGDMVLVLDRNRRLVGRLDRELGRPAVRHGTATTWLVGLDQIMGVVVAAEPALVSMLVSED